MHIAAKYGQTGVIKALLDRNVDPNIKGKNGLTPLHVAAHYNQALAVEMLLKYKADPLKTAKVVLLYVQTANKSINYRI